MSSLGRQSRQRARRVQGKKLVEWESTIVDLCSEWLIRSRPTTTSVKGKFGAGAPREFTCYPKSFPKVPPSNHIRTPPVTLESASCLK